MSAIKNHYHDEICRDDHYDPVSTCDECGGYGWVEVGDKAPGSSEAWHTGGKQQCIFCDGRGVVMEGPHWTPPTPHGEPSF
jgi:hypothetical protein